MILYKRIINVLFYLFPGTIITIKNIEKQYNNLLFQIILIIILFSLILS